MKTLTLELKKKVLIVDDAEHGSFFPPDFVNYTLENEDGKWKFLCQGTPTEEQAAQLVDNFLEEIDIDAFENYSVSEDYLNKDHWAGVADSAVESFLSAISANGWNWLVNPLGEEPRSYSEVMDGVSADELMDDLKDWQESEARTFKNPIIFIKE